MKKSVIGFNLLIIMIFSLICMGNFSYKHLNLVDANNSKKEKVGMSDTIRNFEDNKIFNKVAAPSNQSIIINTPEYKNYQQPMSGFYPATYGFENEVVGTEGIDIEFLDAYYNSNPLSNLSIGIVDEYLGHKDLMHVYDASHGIVTGAHHFASPPVAGTIEFYQLAQGTTGAQSFSLRAMDETTAMQMHMITTSGAGFFQYYNGSSFETIGNLTVDTWYHHSIAFDCETGVNGTGTWIISFENGTEVGRLENIDFDNSLNTIDKFYWSSHFVTNQLHMFYDAFGFSWNPAYTSGDNLVEGLFLNYFTPTPLNWTAYSLDGGTNITIRTNTTIPMPAQGRHTIQIFGNDTLGNNYHSDLITFSVRQMFDIYTPEDKNYLQPMAGFYPATYGFENEVVGTELMAIEFVDWYWRSNVFDQGIKIGITDEYLGHKNLMHLKDASGHMISGAHHFDAPPVAGTIEFFQLAQGTTGAQSFSLRAMDDTTAIQMHMVVTSGVGVFQYYNDSSWQTIGDLIVDTWYHHSITFDCDTGVNGTATWIISHENGTEVGRVDNFDFDNNLSAIDKFHFTTHFVSVAMNMLYDAFGFSWDPGYTIGDNLNEGLLLAYTSDIRNIGHYPGTYSFENDLNGAYPAGFYGSDQPGLIETRVVDEFNGHSKVLKCWDGGDSAWNLGHYINVTEGTTEFWMASSTNGINKPVSFAFLPQAGPTLFGVSLHQSNIYLFDVGGAPYGTIIGTYSINSWQHIRLDFRTNSSTTPYSGLTINQFKVFLNGSEVGIYDFQSNGDLNETRLYSLYTGGGWWGYYDAISYSWEPGYIIGDNLYEELIPITWLAYSLNGQTNVTILGNHTIPMPTPGSYTIQVFGNDTLGINYHSKLRSFQIIPPDPPTISGPNDFNFNFGEKGYSIIWSTSDPEPSNYTIYQNGTIFKQGNWTTSVLVSLEGIEQGSHNFTCIVENIYGITASDEVWVTVLPAAPDTNPPIISSPEDISFEEGSIGYSIIWSGSDNLEPWWGSVWRDTMLIYSQAWIGNDIIIILDGLSNGTYLFNCTLSDEAGNSVFDIVQVTVDPFVSDTSPPNIIPPASVIIEEGSVGNELTWICHDDHPYAYKVLLNNTDILYNPWHGENVTISIDGLPIAQYSFTLVLYDISGNNVSSSVLVEVIPPLPDLTPPTMNTPAPFTVAEYMGGTIIWEVFDEHPGQFIILKNGTEIYNQEWNSGIVQFTFSYLPEGNWVFTLQLWDEARNFAESSVIITVVAGTSYDAIIPEISHYPDVTYIYGSKNNTVEFFLFDTHAAGYNIHIDTIKFMTSMWTTSNIHVIITIDGLEVGLHILVLEAWDSFGNTASESIQITVSGDITPPDISSPADIKVTEGVSTIQILWTADETFPSYYKIINLDTKGVIQEENWAGDDIKLPLVEMRSGKYRFRCYVYDVSGNYAFDDVVVTIEPSKSTPGFEFGSLFLCLIGGMKFRRNMKKKRRSNK